MSSENLGPVVPLVYWPGSGSSPVGKTPLGLYEDDDAFLEEAPRVAKWVCHSLGYPVMDVELTDEMIYSQFEQSITEFSSLVHEFNLREHMLTIQGLSTGSSITGLLVKNNPLPTVIEMSMAYGTEAQSGGNVDFKRGFVTLENGVQDYDLNQIWAAVSESGNRVEIRRIWHDRPPALRRFFDPFAGAAGSGMGIENLLGEFGWGNYSIATQYLLMPIYETILRGQAIEFNDLIRRSQYSFEIKNNKLRIFPIPDSGDAGEKLWFEYTVNADKYNNMIGAPGYVSGSTSIARGGVVSDYSNAPYSNIMYSHINDIGKRWIRKYTLAMVKVMLGNIRNKYAQIPIPNAQVQLNGDSLIQQGNQEMAALVETLRETLDMTGKNAQMRKLTENETNSTEILRKAPNLFYIG